MGDQWWIDADDFVDAYLAEMREDLAMWEAEQACPLCGLDDLWRPALEEAPDCPRCGAEMISTPRLRKPISGADRTPPDAPGVEDPESA